MPENSHGVSTKTKPTYEELLAENERLNGIIAGTRIPLNPGPLTDEQLDILLAPLNRNRVSTRTQGGASLSYVEAWDIKAMLTRIFGFGGYSAEVIEARVLNIEPPDPNTTPPRKNYTVLAQSTERLTIHSLGAVYTETAAASQTGPQIGEVTDFAIKTASSDALKRCAIYLGAQFGLGLYNQGSLTDPVRVIFAPDQYRPPAPVDTAKVDAMIARATQPNPEAQS